MTPDELWAESLMEGEDVDDLTDILERPHWMVEAACRGRTSLFFPERGETGEEARQVCAGCPCREPCLETALLRRERYGIWGGTSSIDRKQLRAVISRLVTEEAA